MKVYEMGRREGKTVRCIIELAKNPKAILLVGNKSMKRMIIEDYGGIENIRSRVFAPHELTEIDRYYRDYDIIIDELDYVLNGLIGHNVKFATITGD